MTLSCNASGIPPPMVSWFKADGQRIDQSELVLTNINRSEAGEYRCEASNECGNASETATIDVQCKLTVTYTLYMYLLTVTGYEWVPANLLLEITLQWTTIPSID